MSSATETAHAIRSGSLTARAASEAALTEIGTDPLNAFTDLDRTGALARADSIDTQINSGLDPGPMAGVPIGVKDLIDHAGRVTTAGSSFFRAKPSLSATCVKRLEDAGAVIIGRTGLHEFAFGFSSENAHFGSVRNPWDPTTSPGGSSGGSAAAVAAGWLPLALGTDTGGSVRVPAALCGVLGLKVTHGAIPLTGVFPLAPSLDTVGPIARTIDDLELAFDLMAGRDPSDPWSEEAAPSVGRPGRLGLPTHWIESAQLAAEVQTAFTEAVDRIADAGWDVVEIDEPALAPSPMIDTMAYGEVAPFHRAWWSDHPERYGREVAERMEVVYQVTLDEHIAAGTWRAGVQNAAAAVFKSVDVLLTPATCVTRKPIGADEVPTAGGPIGYRRALAWFSALVNHLNCPAIVMPLAAAGAPPPALQVIGPRWSEHRLLSLGRRLTTAEIVAEPEPAPRERFDGWDSAG